MSEEICRAIVAMSDLINNREALNDAASHLKAAFALQKEEIEQRNQLRELIREEEKLRLDLDSRQKQLDMRESDLLKQQEAFTKKIQVQENSYTSALINLDQQRDDYAKKRELLAKEISALENRQDALTKAELEIQALKNELRAQKDALDEKQARVDKILAAAVG